MQSQKRSQNFRTKTKKFVSLNHNHCLTLSTDVESPSFGATCPSDIKRYADKAKNYTTVNWAPVVATDNSGVTPSISSSGVKMLYHKGRHLVMYNASDETGNYKICKFYVIVEGKDVYIGQGETLPCIENINFNM